MEINRTLDDLQRLLGRGRTEEAAGLVPVLRGEVARLAERMAEKDRDLERLRERVVELGGPRENTTRAYGQL
jgi:hypothetical protein